MKTLDLHEAAELVMLHPSTLLAKARAGDIPAAKPGKYWVFIDIDLIDWLRGQYSTHRQDVSANNDGDSTCSLKDKKATIGILNLPLKAKQYTDLLEPATKVRRKK